MRRAIVGSILLVAVAMILGGTVFRDQVANARSLIGISRLYVQIKCVCPERDEIPYYLDIPIEVQGGQGMLDLGDGIYVDQNRDRAAVGDAIKFGFATGGDGVTTRGFSALVLGEYR